MQFGLILGYGTILMWLAGCQFFGPTSIQIGRPIYNEVIQQTSKLQTFANIIRVFRHEPTSFMDVSQINAQFTVQSTLMGAVAGIGGIRTGSANMGLLFQENPVITYSPLTGQSLVSQITTPITVDALANLINSDWPISSVLGLSADRLTPGYEDYSVAMNSLIALDHLGAITISVTNVQIPIPRTTKSSKDDGSGKSTELNLVLEITLQPSHPYTGGDPVETSTQTEIQNLWCSLVRAITGNGRCPSPIANLLLAVNISPSKKESGLQPSIYLIKTRSAIGILKASTEVPGPLVAIVPEDRYKIIASHPWNSKERLLSICPNSTYYTLLPTDEGNLDNPTFNPNNPNVSPEVVTVNREVVDKIVHFDRLSSQVESCLYTVSTRYTSNDLGDALREARLRSLRRFMLIIESDHEIGGSYVSYFDGRKWYSIDPTDDISQKNFVLISQFLTMQATVTTTPPPVPTISIGGTP